MFLPEETRDRTVWLLLLARNVGTKLKLLTTISRGKITKEYMEHVLSIYWQLASAQAMRHDSITVY
jgi:hypothetical protein